MRSVAEQLWANMRFCLSKEVFATGSINAALFLCGRPNGLYNMGDLVSGMAGQ